VVDLATPTEPSARRTPRSPLAKQRAVGLAVAALAVTVTVTLVVISRLHAANARSALESGPAPSATPSPGSALPVQAPSSVPSALVPSAVALPELPAPPPATAPEPAALAAPAGSATRAGSRSGVKRQPTRKSGLTIAKEPNF
jgi:hypothetical protein